MVMSLPSPSRTVNAPFPTTKKGASAGCELVTADGRTLALTAASLRVDARGGIARCVLEQRFENKFDERLHVTYRMPLPADGAVSGYAFTIGDRVVRGVVDRKQKARERFERAIASGHTAALLEQERADIFTQSLGNIPPGEAITVAIEIDQRLVWLPEGEWELRFPTVIGPRYIGTADTMNDARATHVKVTTEPLGVHVSAHIAIGDAITGGRRATSPTHSLTKDDGGLSLGGGVRLDRDIVVRWPVAAPSPGLSLAIARPAKGDESFGLLTIVPPARDAKATPVARDLIVLLDTSGSMDGGPLEKAKQVVALLIDSLEERDRFELIEFNYQPTRYQDAPEHATAAAKKAAIKWVASRRADGGTEMRAGVLEALKTLRIGAQRQIVVVTDGYVGGEHQILVALQQRLPASCRLHVLGVGSAVNRSLAIALARVGRGAEVILGIDEDAERGAKRLLDRTTLPMLTNVTISGDALVAQAPEQMPDVFEGSPCLAALMLSTEGGEIIVRGETASGAWEQRTRVQPLRSGDGNQGIVALYGRERVADLEARTMLDPADGQIEEVGLRFQIATRLTSWIAVDETRVVTGTERTQNVPQELPYGTKAQSFGLRGSAGDLLGRDTSRMSAVSLESHLESALYDVGEASDAFDDLESSVAYSPAPARSAPPRPAPAMGPAMRPGPARPGGTAPPPSIPMPPSQARIVATRAGGYAPPADEGGDGPSDFDQEAPTGEMSPPSFGPAPSMMQSPPPMSARPPRPTEAAPMPPAPSVPMATKAFTLGSSQPEQPKPEPVAAAPEAAPEKSRMRASTQPGYPMKESAKAIAPMAVQEMRLEALPQAAPYKKPPRFALWLILALVMAIIAALVWWLAS